MDNTASSPYEIRVQGHLAPRRLCCFDGLTITHHPCGETSLVGLIRDQAALYGLLNHLHNIGAIVLSLNRASQLDIRDEHRHQDDLAKNRTMHRGRQQCHKP